MMNDKQISYWFTCLNSIRTKEILHSISKYRSMPYSINRASCQLKIMHINTLRTIWYENFHLPINIGDIIAAIPCVKSYIYNSTGVPISFEAMVLLYHSFSPNSRQCKCQIWFVTIGLIFVINDTVSIWCQHTKYYTQRILVNFHQISFINTRQINNS